ncbi:MAG: ketoacyl-ACP synthase III [Acidobacteria bacterium]|nr:ketoacyl-ACP synthase III [Acidobacteriota bacterium]
MSYLAGFGAALPERVVTNEELAGQIGKTAEWIRNMSGIEERRWAGPETSVADLAVAAGQDCLRRAAAPTSEIRLLLVASGSGERRFPGPASEVAARMGLGETPALDVPIASAGSLFAMVLANDLAPKWGPALVIGAEIMSRVVASGPVEPGVAMLFGDGAGACLVHPEHGKAKLIGSKLASDGTFCGDLKLEADAGLTMNGRTVILQAARKIPRVIRQVLATAGVRAGDVEVYLMHQANQNLMDRVADALNVDRGRFFSNIVRYGNTSAASMLIAAAQWELAEGFRPGGMVCLAGFGAGFHWGAALAEGV